MKDKMHKILDLVFELNEQENIHATAFFFAHTESVDVMVWSGEKADDINKNKLLHDGCYYGGVLFDEEKLNKIIGKLEELKGETK